MTKTVEDRFAAKIKIIPDTLCWEWQGSRQPFGYGYFSFKGRCRLAHRASWEIHNSPVPVGLCVLHRCDNPPCVNPAHLFLGTKADNNNDMIRKGRCRAGGPGGEGCGLSKLTNDSVRAIRAYAKEHPRSAAMLARRYGVSPPTIHRVLNGMTWRSVGP